MIPNYLHFCELERDAFHIRAQVNLELTREASYKNPAEATVPYSVAQTGKPE